jgi:type IV pilus assembly protein PilX
MISQRRCHLSSRTRGPRQRQRGVVLLIALIVLVALMLASVSLVRSVDTANVIAGNLAFKQASVQAADFGIEAAATALPDIVATTLDTDVTPGSSGALRYRYYATRRVADANGVPTQTAVGTAGAPAPIDWSTVPVADTRAGNVIRVVIDRLCTGPAPVADPAASCFHEASNDGGSQSINKQVFTSVTMVYYRVTVQVTGPRNTVSMVQAILGI